MGLNIITNVITMFLMLTIIGKIKGFRPKEFFNSNILTRRFTFITKPIQKPLLYVTRTHSLYQ